MCSQFHITNEKRCRIIHSWQIITLIVLPIVYILLVSSCHSQPDQASISLDDILIGHNLPIVDYTYQENNGNSQLTLICSPYDCQPCLDIAFAEISRISKEFPSIKISVISVLGDPSPIQDKYSFYDYIPFDEEDIVRKSLKFVPTPVVLVSDSNDIITGYHFPRQYDNIKVCVKHIEKYL